MRTNSKEYQKIYHQNRKKILNPILSLDGEVWINIENYDGVYQVSNMGRIKRCASLIPNKRWGTMKLQEKLVSPGITKGYYYIKLSKNDFKKSFLLHRLVATYFIPNPSNKKEVNHLFGKNDNSANSLEWSTKAENMEHSVINGLHKSGEKASNSKLTEKTAIEIFTSPLSERRIAKLYNVSRGAVSGIKSGRTWKKVIEQYKQLL